MTEFRASELSDADALQQIWRNAVDATHDFLSPEDREVIDPLVAEYVRTVELVVAIVDGAPVAFMGVTGQNIDSLFIDPKAHGKGIGRLMADRVGLPATVDVNEQNEAAVAFYRHLGFEVVGRSEQDGEGRPYPLLHLLRRQTSSTRRP
jgi:putative acetyltransferase